MAGTTANEFVGFFADLDPIPGGTLEEALGAMGLSRDQTLQFMARNAERSLSVTAGQVVTDRWFRLPAHSLLEAQQRAGGAAFAYEFRWSPPSGPRRGQSFHCLDIPFVFDLLDADGVVDAAGNDAPQSLASEMHAAFVRFVRDGSPGWSRYQPATRPTMIFTSPESTVRSDPLRVERELWGGRAL
jgi:para-nitrobenzyl esterase